MWLLLNTTTVLLLFAPVSSRAMRPARTSSSRIPGWVVWPSAPLERGLRSRRPVRARDLRQRLALRGPRLQRPSGRGRAGARVRRRSRRMAAMRPDRIVIACNTLSILYPHTDFSRAAAMPVLGIVDAGVDLFAERLREDPARQSCSSARRRPSSRARTAIGSPRAASSPARIASVSCHGLAAAIERDVDGPRTAELLDACASRAADAAPPGGDAVPGAVLHPLRLRGRPVRGGAGAKTGTARASPARPGQRSLALPRLLSRCGGALDGQPRRRRDAASSGRRGPEAVSGGGHLEGRLSDASRRAIARLIEPVSPASARALLSYVARAG